MENSSVQRLEAIPNTIVPQTLDTDAWEPPFDRWLRIADAVLANASSASSQPLSRGNDM